MWDHQENGEMAFPSNPGLGFSVIIVNYQGNGLIERCLESVLNNSYRNIEIILVDNNSTDGSLDYAEKILSNFSEKTIIRNTENVGFCIGFNQGMKLARYEYMLLLNNDASIEKDALLKYLYFFEHNPNVMLAEGRILNESGTIKGYTTNPEVQFIFGILQEAGNISKDPESFGSIKRIYSPMGVWPVYRKSAYLRLGGYDEDFFHTEDIRDISARVWLSGYEVGYVYDAIVHHMARLNSVNVNYGSNISDMLLFHATKNCVSLFIKNFQAWTIIKNIVPFISLKSIDMCFDLFTFNLKDFKIKLKAYSWIVRNFQTIIQKRKNNSIMRSVNDKNALKYAKKPSIESIKHAFLGKIKMEKNRHVPSKGIG